MKGNQVHQNIDFYFLLDPPERKSKWIESKPKTRDKQINREKRDSKAKSVGTIVVVKAAAEAPTLETNPLYRRLAVRILS